MPARRTLLRRTARSAIAIVALAAVAACSSSTDSSSAGSGNSGSAAPTTTAPKTSRGFDGATITVAGFGLKAQLPGSEWGARARVAKFNEANELPGIKINYAEFADDKQDQATALSEVRRLATDTKVFAIVGDVSQFNPGDFMTQQHLPYFGAGFDNTYCSQNGDTTGYGFGVNGCVTPSGPKDAPDYYGRWHEYLQKALGKQALTIALFSSDSDSGKASVATSEAAAKGAGFDVVFAKGILPPPPITDYTPYVQQLLNSNNGSQPDAVVCLAAVDCIATYKGLGDAGFKGAFFSSLYSDLLTAAMSGSYASSFWAPADTPTDGYADLTKYLTEVKPDVAIDLAVVAGWASTDMFIQAVKAAEQNGGISPENVHDQAMHQTWEIKGFAGPTRYPDALAHPSPLCSAIVHSDGTAWQTVVPYGCSDKTYPLS